METLDNILKQLKRIKISFNTLLLIIFLVGVGFYFIGTPRTGDDYGFLVFFKPWFDSQPELINEQGITMVDKRGCRCQAMQNLFRVSPLSARHLQGTVD